MYIGSAFPRLPRPLRGLAMTIRECMPFSRWPVSCAGAAPGGTCPSPTIITMFNVYLEESRWRIRSGAYARNAENVLFRDFSYEIAEDMKGEVEDPVFIENCENVEY